MASALALWGVRLGLLLLLAAVSVSSIKLPDSYDVVWNTQSNNSAGSMPVSGGDVGLNAWVENGMNCSVNFEPAAC